MQGHTKGKVDILQANGFTDVSAILCESTPVEEVKDILRASPNSLFIVGGAMMKGFPDLMSELLAFIEVGNYLRLFSNTLFSRSDDLFSG